MVSFEQTGWYRIDPHGNKPGVNTEFLPAEKILAYPISHEGDYDVSGIYSESLPEVIAVLTHYTAALDVTENLPDCRILPGIG